MQDIRVHATKEFDLLGFLSSQDFEVEVLSENVSRISKNGDLPVFVSHNDGSLYFEVDIGSIKDMTSQSDNPVVFLQQLLNLNTEVLPVSFGINDTNPSDPHLVLVESRVTGDLNDEELLSVFNALYLAADKAEKLLSEQL